MKFSIVIPCYNERDNLANLLGQITPLQREFDLEYVLVENGSTDGSKGYFASHIEGKFPGIKVAYVPVNQGYGYGIQQGLKAADGDYVGWVHADMQVRAEDLVPFFRYAMRHEDQKLYLQGHRSKRSSLEQFFMHGESLVCSVVFQMGLHDVPAMPILFHRDLLKSVRIEDMPDDFSIDIYVHVFAKRLGFVEKRHLVKVMDRENGQSAWNRGLKSRIRQSWKIIMDCFRIRMGMKVRS